jgi:hypothetical protein
LRFGADNARLKIVTEIRFVFDFNRILDFLPALVCGVRVEKPATARQKEQ